MESPVLWQAPNVLLAILLSAGLSFTPPLPAAPGLTPHLAPQEANEHWDPRFSLPGVDDTVYALAVDGTGDLYAEGNFASACGVSVKHIGHWDGRVMSV